MTLLRIPLVRQSQDYSCGAASLASVFYYWGVWDGREPELFPLLDTNEEGTGGESIMQVARDFGLSASYEENMTIDRLNALVQEGNTLIINIQAWVTSPIVDWSQVWDDGHYVVVVGIKDGIVFMMDPATAGRYGMLTVSDLEARWHDYTDEDGSGYAHHPAIIIKGSQPAQPLHPIFIL